MELIKKNVVAIVVASFLLLTKTYGQDETQKSTDIYIDFGAGVSYTSFNNAAFTPKAGLTYVMNNKYSFSASTILMTGSMHKPYNLYFSSCSYVSIGQRFRMGKKHWYYTPSIGLGLQMLTYTTGLYTKETWDKVHGEDNSGSNLLGLNIFSIKYNYETAERTNLAVPINISFMHASRFAGTTFNFFFIASRDPLMGINLCWDLGKIRGRDR